MVIETQIRQAIRDAVNRNSRKPFYWGGIVGYQQLEAIAQALHQEAGPDDEREYLQRLTRQADRVLEKNRSLAEDLKEAHQWLERMAKCLRYPPRSYQDSASDTGLNSQRVAQEMEALLQQFQPDAKYQPAQTSLYDAFRKRWKLYGKELLYCYDVPGLPPDNLQMESLFGRLRCHQRRISGRKSTRELRDFGQAQVLFLVESEETLLKQMQRVPLAAYQVYRRRLAQAEAPRQFFHRLHRNPLKTMQRLVNRHAARRVELASHVPPLPVECAHTY